MENKIGAAEDIKNVGMWLDHSLTMRKQVATVCSKVSRNISLIRRNRTYLSIESCQKLGSGPIMGYEIMAMHSIMDCQTKKSQSFRDFRIMLQKQSQAEINMIVHHWPDINWIGYLWRKG